MLDQIVNTLKGCAGYQCNQCKYKGKENCKSLLCDEMGQELRKVGEEIVRQENSNKS